MDYSVDIRAKQAEAASRKTEIANRLKDSGPDPELSGFEDEFTRDLILARRYLRKTQVATLKPVLPLLLRLKGRPYRLHNYFPFEPFFRTRMPTQVLLKTGRQVSKCLRWWQLIQRPDGTMTPVHLLNVGDYVVSLSSGGEFVSRKVTNVWFSGVKDVITLRTAEGATVGITEDHRMLAEVNGEKGFFEGREIRPGDLLAVRNDDGRLAWELVTVNEPAGQDKTVDIEVEETHNFVADRCVSHNSTSLASQGVLFANSIPHFATLYVTPLYEMIRRFSHNYVRPFIEESPVRRLFTGIDTTNSVLQRTFKNGSAMYFSYAFLDAERTRGIPADRLSIDEIQDMAYDLLPILHETLSGSPWGLVQMAGTPKSFDNTMQRKWEDSSQAEWAMKCRVGGCGHLNIPSTDWDLLDMIGPWRRDISQKEPGIVCAKCRKPIDPRGGRWLHRFKERRWTFPGYHVPQIIMPMHYGDQEKWLKLLGKMSGKGDTTPTVFFNEVCGESSDIGAKLLTKTDMMAACILPWENKAKQALASKVRYVRRILSVDWGGGGGVLRTSSKGGDQKRERTSFTTLSVLGMKPDGTIDVIWGCRSLRTHDWEYEAQLCLEAMKVFRCSHIAHDYNGAGEGRLMLLYQAGLPPTNILNMSYQPFGHNIINYHPSSDDNPHDWYAVDKSRSLVTTCMAIKHGLIRFFKYDYVSADDMGLLEDFMALVEEKLSTRLKSDSYIITRNPNKSDDFAQAVNIGACCLWHMTKRWPNIALAAKFIIPDHVRQHISPKGQIDWDDF